MDKRVIIVGYVFASLSVMRLYVSLGLYVAGGAAVIRAERRTGNNK